jgi:signal transduction histidine kinase
MSVSARRLFRIPTVGPLRARLIIFAILAVALPTGLFVRHAATERQRLLEEAESHVSNLSRSWAEEQAQVLEQASAMLDAASQIPDIRDLNATACASILKELSARHKWAIGLSVIGKDRTLVCSSNPGALPETALTGWSFIDDLETARTITFSEFVKTRYHSKGMYFAGVPLVAGKSFTGALVVALDPAWVGDKNVRIGSSIESIVIDRFGSIVSAEPAPGGEVGDRLPYSIVSRLSIESEGTSFERDAHGVERIFAFRQVPATGAKLVIDIPRDQVLGAEERNYSRTLMMLCAVAALAVLLAGIGAEYVIFRWIDLLTTATRRIGDEDAPDLAIPRSAGEFALLAQAFNLMSRRLKSRQRALAESEARAREIAEEARRSEEKLRRIASNVPGLVFQLMRDPDGRLSFRYVSERVQEIYGASAAQIYDSPELIFDKGHPADRPELRRSLEQSRASLRPWRHEYRIASGDGWRWLQIQSIPKAYADGTVVWDGVAIEITKLKEQEGQLRSALKEAEAANIAKRDFLATMSHELRTPLNAIIGFSRIMVDEMLGPMENTLYLDYARDVHQAGQHLLTLIDGILDLSRSETEQVTLDMAPVDVGGLALYGTTLVAKRAEEAIVKLECRAAPAIPLVVGDESRLQQVIVNLLTNAIKFTPAGGEVTISVTPTENDSVAIVVSDTGIGIAPEHLSKVFEPFFQVDGSLNRTLQEGVGMGLPLARRLTELHGGRLDIESEVGRGTTVTVFLPIHHLPAITATGAQEGMEIDILLERTRAA